MTNHGKRCTVSSTYDMVAKLDILFSSGSYAEPVAKAFITVGYVARMGPIAYKPVVIRIAASYLQTVDEGPSGELTFYSSEWFLLFVAGS